MKKWKKYRWRNKCTVVFFKKKCTTIPGGANTNPLHVEMRL